MLVNFNFEIFLLYKLQGSTRYLIHVHIPMKFLTQSLRQQNKVNFVQLMLLLFVNIEFITYYLILLTSLSNQHILMLLILIYWQAIDLFNTDTLKWVQNIPTNSIWISPYNTMAVIIAKRRAELRSFTNRRYTRSLGLEVCVRHDWTPY